MRPLASPRAVVVSFDVRTDCRFTLQEGMMVASLGHHLYPTGQPFPTGEQPLPLVSSTRAVR